MKVISFNHQDWICPILHKLSPERHIGYIGNRGRHDNNISVVVVCLSFTPTTTSRCRDLFSWKICCRCLVCRYLTTTTSLCRFFVWINLLSFYCRDNDNFLSTIFFCVHVRIIGTNWKILRFFRFGFLTCEHRLMQICSTSFFGDAEV